MSNLTQFGGGGIKAKYTGTITIALGQVINTATIAAVDVNKSVLTKLGETSPATDAASFFLTLALTNSTTITASRSGSTASASVNYQLIEYY